MSIKYHRKSEGICLHDHERWPCKRVQQFDEDCGAILDIMVDAVTVDLVTIMAVAVAEDAMRRLSPME